MWVVAIIGVAAVITGCILTYRLNFDRLGTVMVISGIVIAIIGVFGWLIQVDQARNNAVATEVASTYGDRLRITDADIQQVEFDLLSGDGRTVEIHCVGTVIQDSSNHYVIAQDSLTPACRDALAAAA